MKWHRRSRTNPKARFGVEQESQRLREPRARNLDRRSLFPRQDSQSEKHDHRSILVIDDDEFGRSLLSRILESAGHRVQQAASGDEALWQIRSGEVSPGMILLDLVMPGLSGWEFLERIADEPTVGDVPIVVVTAAGDATAKNSRGGVVAFFQKPIQIEELLAVIREHLGSD